MAVITKFTDNINMNEIHRSPSFRQSFDDTPNKRTRTYTRCDARARRNRIMKWRKRKGYGV